MRNKKILDDWVIDKPIFYFLILQTYLPYKRFFQFGCAYYITRYVVLYLHAI